jgi:ACR3 family arsenite transporter
MFILDFIREKLAYLIPVAILLGLINGIFHPMEYSRVICVSALFLMILPIFVNLEILNGLKEIGKSLKAIYLSSFINFIVYPLIAYVLGYFFLQEHKAIWFGLVMLSLVPTSGMTIGWTYRTKGNITTSMAIISLSTIFACVFLPFAIPLIANSILGENYSDVSRIIILEKLFFIIIIPAILGFIIKKLIIKFSGNEKFEKIKPLNSSISALGVLVVTFLIMSLKATQSLTSNPELFLVISVPTILFYIIILSLSHILGNKFLDKDNAKSFFFSTAARYHVITLGVVLGTFQESEFLGLITATIALGLAIQIPALAFYAKYLTAREKQLNPDLA